MKVKENVEMDKWQHKALELLREACTPWGIKAALVEKDNYSAIFTRDAVMSGIAGLLLKDEIVIEGFKNTLLNLKNLQGEQGQIPSNFTIVDGRAAKISFGTLSPKIDACTWYLIGVGLLIKEDRILKEDFQQSAQKTIALLDTWEYNGKHLMYIPKGGNWADEYVYEGYILYDQILRSWALSLLAKAFKKPLWEEKSLAIKACIAQQYINDDAPFLIASFYPGGRFTKFDLAAHTLVAIVMDEKQLNLAPLFRWIDQQFLENNQCPPVFYPPIKKGHADWEVLKGFHLFGFKNKPNHYHNGGVWWIWLGWLSIALSLWQKKQLVLKLTDISIHYLNDLKTFDFDEYLSFDQLIPCGTPKLCFTATGIIFLSMARNNADFSTLSI